jgi:hypothetical protein
LPQHDGLVRLLCSTRLRIAGRMGRHALFACGGLMSLAAALTLGLVALLYFGPVQVDFLRQRVVADLQASFGGQHKFSVAGIRLGLVDGAPAARLDNMTVSDTEGRVVMSTPAASVVFDPLSLLSLRLAPKRLAISRLDLRLDIRPDGSVAFAAGDSAERPLEPVDTAIEGVHKPPPGADGGVPVAARSAAIVRALAEFEKAFAENGVLDQLQGVSITDSRLIVHHLGNGRALTYDNVQVSERRDGPEARTLTVTGTGPRGPLTIEIASRRGEDAYLSSVTASGMALSDAATLAGLPAVEPAADPTVSLQAEARLDATRSKATITAKASLGPLHFSVDGTPEAMIDLDESSVALDWNSESGAIRVDRLRLVSGGNLGELSGELVPDAAVPGRFAIALRSVGGRLAALSPEEKPLALPPVRVEGTLDTNQRRLALPVIAITGEGYTVNGRLVLSDTPEGPTLDWGLDAAHVPVRQALRIWPTLLSPPVRSHLVQNLSSGTLESLKITSFFNPAVFQDVLNDRPLANDSVRGDYRISDATLSVVEGLPPLTHAEVSGFFMGRSAMVNLSRAALDLGGGRSLAVSEGVFAVPDTSRKPPMAQADFRLKGSADAAADLLARPPLRPRTGEVLDPAQVKGNADARVTIRLPLVAKLKRDDVTSVVQGNLSNFSLDKAFGDERLEAANLAISNDGKVTTAKGEGRVFGTQASLSLRQTSGQSGEVTVQFTADEALRAKRGFGPQSGLKGPVVVTAKAPVQKLGPGDETTVTLDLTKAEVDGLVPGWTKSAGKPAKASFTYKPSKDGTRFEDFSLDAGPVQIKGLISLDHDGALRSARLDTFKLSPSDSLRVDVDRAGSGYKTTVRGNSLDARGLLKASLGAADDSQPRRQGKSQGSEIDLKVAILSGYNGEAMANAELRLASDGSNLRRLDFSATLNGKDVRGGLNQPSARGGVLSVISDDAGGLLRFLDVYPRMRGGQLQLQLSGALNHQNGVMSVRDFALHDEPALRSMAAGQARATASAADVTGATPATADVPFSRLRAEFVREPDKLTFKDAVMWGQQVGGSVSGTMDYGRDRVHLTGTFVPAYQLNNFFARVPLLGRLLGGGEHEGLFAVSFQISGKASAPVLQISPLSALAPGFLRKLFEFQREDAVARPPKPVESNR